MLFSKKLSTDCDSYSSLSSASKKVHVVALPSWKVVYELSSVWRYFEVIEGYWFVVLGGDIHLFSVVMM